MAVASDSGMPMGQAAIRHAKRDQYSGFDDPRVNGGYMLTIAQNTNPPGLGEPLNTILSADSDARVLALNSDEGGFLNYMLSTSLGEECLGQHYGDYQMANLGDGQGNVTEMEVLRWNYGDIYIGTCRETFNGGLHLRYWRQNNTGAYFMAVSEELDLAANHLIAPNGYNLGRDHMVGNLTDQQSVIPTLNLTNTSTYSGSSSWANYTYETSVKYISGLLQNSSEGVNHPDSVAVNGRPAIDGLVAVLTVKITGVPPSSGALINVAVPVSAFVIVLSTAMAMLL
ncbi:hypothetical protein NliqN6_3312 [Naganishia liquefaciens]|uniref:Uncharacterized protein n=1 Tax=Naganishia liquefaciens TaxID=104408 RepID=A0A8H3TUF8_9TREE|nr:hypothetical protein NliqN6_3312 [Naganishia liquefaciens]